MLSVPKLDFRSCFVQNKYIYGDANGNMTKDNNKDINSISYNHLNLPTSVTFADDRSIRYTYDATGVKLKKEIFLSLPDLFNPVANTTTYYAGNYIYEKDGSGESLKFFSHPEGYIEKNASNYDYVYQYKDHSCLRRVPRSAARGRHVRLSYQDMNNDGSVNSSEIKEENNYYPFGLKHNGYNNLMASGQRDHNYGFGGKEEQDELGLEWMDFHARNYDASLGRWMNIDPLADAYTSWSPYNYTYNNPILFTDSTGMCVDGDCPDDEEDPPVELNGGELDEIVLDVKLSEEGKKNRELRSHYSDTNWEKREHVKNNFSSLFSTYLRLEAKGVYPKPSLYNNEFNSVGAELSSGWNQGFNALDENTQWIMNTSAYAIGGTLGTTVAAPMFGYAGAELAFDGLLHVGFHAYINIVRFQITYGTAAGSGAAGAGMLRLGPNMTRVGSKQVLDIGHRASTFVRPDIIRNGTIMVRDHSTIILNTSQFHKQGFSTIINPWTRSIIHESIGQISK